MTQGGLVNICMQRGANAMIHWSWRRYTENIGRTLIPLLNMRMHNQCSMDWL